MGNRHLVLSRRRAAAGSGVSERGVHFQRMESSKSR